MIQTVITWLRTLCLSIWIGGIGTIGAIVAPVAFRHSGLSRIEAGRVIGESLFRFNWVCCVAAGLLIGCEVVEWTRRGSRGPTRRDRGRIALSALLVGLTLYLGFGLAPRFVAAANTNPLNTHPTSRNEQPGSSASFHGST